MNNRLPAILLSVLAAALCGCVATKAPVNRDEQLPLPAAAQLTALGAEEDGDYRAALRYWRQAELAVGEKVERLAAGLAATARDHAERGAALYAERDGEGALAAFLAALRHDPYNDLALEYLLNRYAAEQSTTYMVGEGDGFAAIAEAVYGDPGDVFAVIHFSGVKGEEELRPGMEIELPRLDTFSSPQLLAYRRDILAARRLFREHRYESLLPLAERILARHPGDAEASYLLNSTLIRRGEELRGKEEYEEAAAMYSRVDPAFRNVADTIREIRRQQREKAAKDSRRRNARLLDQGRELLSQGEYRQALEVFHRIDPGQEGLGEALAEVREALAREADLHYRKGVTLFIQDDLAAAIEEWRKTLSYDPGHEKAGSYIEKALKLLKKVDEIE